VEITAKPAGRRVFRLAFGRGGAKIAPMNKEELKEAKQQLLAEKESIEKELARFRETLDFGDDIDHGEEESDESEEMGNYLSVKKSQDARLEQIEKALGKIAAGTYGICDNCGGVIEKEILKVNPESLLCRSCKMKATGKK
jgi:RNA polymerase-binding transcription factor DksA